MLSSYLTSSYLQYKEDTNAVASWLATTAKKCGYAVDLLIKKTGGEQQQQKQPTGRLKGKARKLARETTKASQTVSAPLSPKKVPTYTIAIKDFVSLAEWVASYDKPPVRVPESFVRAITQAISVRRSHSEQLPRDDEKSDQRHNFFIGVLEHVHDVLRSRMPTESLGTTATECGSSNRFEGLEVQEPSEQFMQALDVTPATSVQYLEVNYEAERLQDMEEAFLAFKLLLEDYNKFRTVISRTWEGYRQGIFDLVSASLMTNTALDIARRIEEDAMPLFDKFDGAERMLSAFYLSLCMDQGEDQGAKEQPGDDMNFGMYEASKTIYWPTYQFLQDFIPMVDSQHLPQYKPGFYGVYDPTTDRSKKTPREKYKEDKIILSEILPEFCLVCLGSEKVTAEDELIRSLRTSFKTKEIPLSLVFATQVYLDIHHILREGVTQGFTDLENIAQLINNSIELTSRFHTSLRVETWPRSNDQVFKEIQQRIDHWVKSDPLIEAKQSLRRPLGEPFQFMKSHPLFCGLYAFSLKVAYQDVSVVFINAWGSIMYTYHLYNAVRQEKLLQNEWKDMDLLFRLQGDVFVGDRPTNPEDYLKRFALSMGYSTTAFAKNKRKGPLQESRRGPRGIEELAPVAQMFKDRFYNGSGQVDLTLQDVQKIVSKSNWEEDRVSEGLSELSLNRTANKSQAATTKQWKDHHQFTAIELLERLRNALLGESLELSFDYLTLHRMCWLLLRSIKENCDPALRDMYGFGYLEKENQLPFTVGYIFMAATSTRKLGNLLVARKSDVVTSKLLVQAASVMDAYIRERGTFVCRVLERGHRILITNDNSDSEADK